MLILADFAPELMRMDHIDEALMKLPHLAYGEFVTFSISGDREEDFWEKIKRHLQLLYKIEEMQDATVIGRTNIKISPLL